MGLGEDPCPKCNELVGAEELIVHGKMCCDCTQEEVEWLRLALKMVRTKAREAWKITTREFAKACGVAPSQLCRWTAEEITEEPDFVD